MNVYDKIFKWLSVIWLTFLPCAVIGLLIVLANVWWYLLIFLGIIIVLVAILTTIACLVS